MAKTVIEYDLKLNRKIMFNTLTLESFEAFLKKLKHYDYYFSYSDDGDVWRRGNKDYLEIKKICDNPEFQSIYTTWEKWFTTKDRPSDCIELGLIHHRLIKERDKENFKLAKPEKAIDFLNNIHFANAYLNSRAREAAELYPKLIWQTSSPIGTVVAKIYDTRIIKVFTELEVCAGRIIIDDVPIAYQHENCLVAYLLAKYW